MFIRLKSELYVQALVRQVQGALAAVYVAKRGDTDAGVIFIRVNRLDGTGGVLSLFTNLDGERLARVVLPPATPEPDIDARLAREMARDPDIWVIDIEDAQGRHFLEEKIDGDWS
ncbi:MAG: DUF1491 family protein [Alphaproteobacteria bacterium]|jgi:hypothetical protein|nr:DUF1491 family protein [Alphaproteobacteria bacterium]